MNSPHKIYRYEVELTITPVGQVKPLKVTRLEHAYSVEEALKQACYMVLAQYPSADIKVARIAPPMADIAQQEKSTDEVRGALETLFKQALASGRTAANLEARK